MKYKSASPETERLFVPKLDELIDVCHPLVRLAWLVDWGEIKRSFNAHFGFIGSLPPHSPRCIAGLLYLQHAFITTDEKTVSTWIENPYWQYFCGETYQQTKSPSNPIRLGWWRECLGDKDALTLLMPIIDAAQRGGIVQTSIIDRTFPNKAVASEPFPHSAENRLAQRGISVFSTKNLPPHERFSVWAEEFSQRFGKVELDSTDRDNFRQSISSISLGGLSIVRTRGSPCSGARLESGLAYADLFPMQLMIKLGPGLNHYSTDGRSVAVGFGQMTMVDSRRPSRFNAVTAAGSVIVCLSPSIIERWHLGESLDSSHKLIAGDRGWSALLAGFLRCVDPGDLSSLTSAEETEAFSDHIGSMLSFALVELGRAREIEHASSLDVSTRGLYGRMIVWMRENHTSIQLSANHLAQEFGVSVRYVHLLFARNAANHTFLQTLHAIRLETAWRLMHSVAGSHLTLAGVAYRSGFSNVNTFRRAFRARYGFLPKSFQKMR